MTKCKIHPYDQSGGVCASCLRGRLLSLQASQDCPSPDLRRRQPPPPSLFPLSPTPRLRAADSDASSVASDRRLRFHRALRIDDARRGSPGCRLSPLSWFSSLIHRRWNKKKEREVDDLRTRKISSPPPMPRRRRRPSCAVSDRGMSPEDDVSEGGYTTESSSTTWRRHTPSRRSAEADIHRRHGVGLSGFTVCLSPLARPTCRRDSGFSGELNRHVSGGGVSFGPNRSRKLADRSRFR